MAFSALPLSWNSPATTTSVSTVRSFRIATIQLPSALTALVKASAWFTMDAVLCASVVSAAALADGAALAASLALSLLFPQPDSNAAATPATINPFTSFTTIPPVFWYIHIIY
ncbi:hypothetical protein D3C86_1873760 [compost metagenome]